MRCYDWSLHQARADGPMTVTSVTLGSEGSTIAGHRRVAAERVELGAGAVQFVFRGVRGDRTCAELALHRRDPLPIRSVRSCLEQVREPGRQELADVARGLWLDAILSGEDDGERLQALLSAGFATVRDGRMGLAHLVPARTDPDGIDVFEAETAGGVGVAGRVVAELLEIHWLNVLFKSDRGHELSTAAHQLIDLVSHPDEIRFAWIAHLVRAAEIGISFLPEQVRAIRMAESELQDLGPFISAGDRMRTGWSDSDEQGEGERR